MAVIVSKGIVVPYYGPPVGTTWLYEDNGTFVVPADGIYQVEMHGGGGGATERGVFNGSTGFNFDCCTGGGSGELYEVTLTEGESISITIGSGGAYTTPNDDSYSVGGTGGATTFGDLSIAGGRGGSSSGPSGGAASGSLATAGTWWSGDHSIGSLAGGQGNKNNTAQTYGDGGYYDGSNSTISRNGQSGAVIITFMGVA